MSVCDLATIGLGLTSDLISGARFFNQALLSALLCEIALIYLREKGIQKHFFLALTILLQINDKDD